MATASLPAGLRVWTERRPGSWDQCTECAYLMVLVAAGFDRFPAGAYTAAERDALDAATIPDPPAGGSTFPIVDTGARARYGLQLRQVPDGSRAGLERELRTPGQALAIAGSLGRFSAGHRLRRWQPDYIGGHAVAGYTLGDGRCWWGDPLAPDGHPGDTVSVAEVLTFAWVPSDARIARAGEWRIDPMAWIDTLQPGTVAGVPTPCLARLPQGAPISSEPGGPRVMAIPYPGGYTARCIGVTGSWGAYLLNDGGLRLFRLADVAQAWPLADTRDALAALADADRLLAQVDRLVDKARAGAGS